MSNYLTHAQTIGPLCCLAFAFSFRFSRPNKACAAWKWSNFLHIQVPRTRRILHLNFAESSIRLFYGDHSGLLVRPHDVPGCRETCHAAGGHGSPKGNMPQRKDTCLAAGKHTSPQGNMPRRGQTCLAEGTHASPQGSRFAAVQ